MTVKDVKAPSAKELAKIAREDLKMRIAEGLEAKVDEMVVDLSSGELLVRDGERDIVIKVIVKTKRLEIEIEGTEEEAVEEVVE